MSFPKVVPPASPNSDTGYAYDFIELGVFMSAPTEQGVADKLREFRIANGREEGNPELDVAMFNGAKLGRPIDPIQPTPETWITLKARQIAGDEAEFVDEEEAQRRAKICSACPENQPNRSPCLGCRNTQERMINLLVTGRPKFEDRLDRCQVYGYSLKLAVLLGAKNLERTDLADSKAPAQCWAKNLTKGPSQA